ncbi:MAG: hypothetical protein ACRDZ4_08185 [Egibacteraceae bacterium]
MFASGATASGHTTSGAVTAAPSSSRRASSSTLTAEICASAASARAVVSQPTRHHLDQPGRDVEHAAAAGLTAHRQIPVGAVRHSALASTTNRCAIVIP